MRNRLAKRNTVEQKIAYIHNYVPCIPRCIPITAPLEDVPRDYTDLVGGPSAPYQGFRRHQWPMLSIYMLESRTMMFYCSTGRPKGNRDIRRRETVLHK